MHKPILGKYEDEQGIVPTQQRGSKPTDCIFVTKNLHIQAGGYLPFGEAPPDHSAL